MSNIYNRKDEIELTITVKQGGTFIDPTAIVTRTLDINHVVRSYITATGWTDGGNWDASANSPSLANGMGVAGQYYTVSVAGEINFGNKAIVFNVGNRVYYNGHEWLRLQNLQTAGITKDSTGVYKVIVYLFGERVYYYEIESIGVAQAAAEGFVRLQNTKFPITV